MRALLAAGAVLAHLLGAALPGAGAASAATPDEQARDQDQERSGYLNAMRLMTQGRHGEARAALEQLIALEPQHAGAWLDLAISHCALGNAAEAERLFREIEVRFAPSAGILEVINGHRASGCKLWQPRSYRSVALARGRDSNVNQGASNPVFATGSGPDRIEQLLADDFLPKPDSYVQASLDYTRELTAAGAVGLVQLRSRHHDSLTDQDTNALLMGLDQPFRLGGLDTRALASISLVSLGGQLYQHQLQLQGRVAPRLPLPSSYELILAASVSHIEYMRRKNFDSNTGEASALFNYNSPRTRVQGALGALFDRGQPGRLGGDRRGWYTSVQWQRALGADYLGELGWTRQDWRGQLAYAPDQINDVRHQSTRQVRAALSKNLTPHHTVQLEWRRVHNKENISLFQYNSQVMQVNWRWHGF